jgi:hypothetical protein
MASGHDLYLLRGLEARAKQLGLKLGITQGTAELTLTGAPQEGSDYPWCLTICSGDNASDKISSFLDGLQSEYKPPKETPTKSQSKQSRQR